MGLNQVSSSTKSKKKAGPKLELYMQTNEVFMDDFLDKEDKPYTLTTMEEKV